MNIKELRLIMGMTQAQFARHIGVSRVTIWKWETGKSNPAKYIDKQINELKSKYQQTY